ncbi:MAG: hypothetical protein MR505_03505 [Bacteroidales bacterium]|nr:hypothetical protein [Bacteroidales bacterium]MCI6727401.1 hypothetical protein [Bacteroidales bacterium]
MTAQEEQALHLFETRVRQLILSYQKLAQDNQRLQQELVEKQQALDEALAQNQQINMDYNNLKLARMMTVNGEDLQSAKNRLSRLIREVDKCIALLNV